jgi:hypothetical protein
MGIGYRHDMKGLFALKIQEHTGPGVCHDIFSHRWSIKEPLRNDEE